MAVVLLTVGVVVAIRAGWVLFQSHQGARGFSYWVGMSLDPIHPPPTFETVLGRLAHTAFPLSAFLPWAIGQLGFASCRFKDMASEERGLAWCLLSTLFFAWATQTYLATWTGFFPFVAPFALAGVAGLAVSTAYRTSFARAVVGWSTAAVVTLLLADFVNDPGRAIWSAASGGAAVMVGPSATSLSALTWAGALVMSGSVLGGLEIQRPSSSAKPRSKDWVIWLEWLRSRGEGNLVFALVLVEAALATLAALTWATDFGWNMPRLANLSPTVKRAVLIGWMLFPATVLLVPSSLMWVRRLLAYLLFPASKGRDWLGWVSCLWGGAPRTIDQARGGLDRASGHSMTLLVLALLLGGGIISVWHVPTLAEGLSPKPVLLAYSRHAARSEPIGLLGLRQEVVRYYLPLTPEAFSDVDSAIDWLVGGRERRWLALDARYLAYANAAHRARGDEPLNLPILAVPSEGVLLAVNRMPVGQATQNPLAEMVRSSPPVPAHRLDARLGRWIEVIGWELRSQQGNLVNELKLGERYELGIFYRSLDAPGIDWKTFVHIDGPTQRINVDHDTTQGHYPTSLWQAGDHIIDKASFAVERGYAQGDYTLYFGLFRGSRRMPVERGRQDEDRIMAGVLRVR